MVIVNRLPRRPQGVQIQVKDPLSKNSKSFTIHGYSLNKIFYKILFYCQQLSKFKKITIVCYKEENKLNEVENEKKIN